jgi:ketosteroid isomerase-like protein
MESSDIQLVREAFEAFARGDLDAALELCDPDIVVRDPGRTGSTIQGRDGLRGFWEEWLENWQEYRVEPQEFIEAGGEVLAHTHQMGLGKLSGIEVGQDLFQVFRVRDCRVVEYRIYAERAEALESVGLTG